MKAPKTMHKLAPATLVLAMAAALLPVATSVQAAEGAATLTAAASPNAAGMPQQPIT